MKKPTPELDKAAACEYLGNISERTLQRYTRQGLLNPRQVKERGADERLHTINLYPVAELDEVKRLIAETPPGASPFVATMPGGAQLGGKDKLSRMVNRPDDGGRQSGLLTALMKLLQQPANAPLLLPGAKKNEPPPVPLAERLTLSVREAHKLTGLSERALLDAIRAGKLKAKHVTGRRGNTIKRTDLDAYVKKL